MFYKPYIMLYFSFFFIFYTVNINAESINRTHVKPVPSLPYDTNPITAIDIYSINMIYHIHKTLFKSRDGEVIPELAKTFSVSQDKTVYSIQLKELNFHNGKKVTSQDCIKSLERAIKSKVLSYDKLSIIKGFSDFINNKRANITGFIATSSNSFDIFLNQPQPNLLHALTEFRYSIVPADGDHKIGTGDYKLQTINHNVVILSRVALNKSSIPQKIIYKQSNETTAIEKFNAAEFHDLFAYSIDYNQLKQLKNNPHFFSLQIPRIFSLMLNSTTLKTEDRYSVKKILNKEAIINNCYPNNTATQDIIPRGFLGHLNKKHNRINTNLNIKKYQLPNLTIAIAIGVGNEECIQETLSHNFKSASIQIMPMDQILDKWNSKTIDIFFGFIEADNTLDIFQLFNPLASFSLGCKNDKTIIDKLQKYTLENDPSKKHNLALKLSQHILDLHTVIPIFTPEHFAVYSNKYKAFKTTIESPSFITTDQLEYVK